MTPPRRRFSGAQICRLLELHGFIPVRQKGSHRIMRKTTPDGSRTIPIPLHKDLKPGTLASIIRQSGRGRFLASGQRKPGRPEGGEA
ncbi:type II toxin-antitoxin system HicA family toxin [Puniceicoccales bacterium CK1056]|uniref:Type II toxin-antitoxin system HicA family toxin n=1 Tax=Oceanipulchritudo coccoides TaxID=2706888 RepID=A0A6B2LYU4_9BACT|nr:type II toxin-antitoxin system HicA family toxin [Oceanipulchritudo coccoides]